MKPEMGFVMIVGWLCCATWSHAQSGLAQAAPPPARSVYVANQQGPSGGSGGSYCDTNDIHPTWTLRSIDVRSGSWIDSIDLTFEAGKAEPSVHCGGTGGDSSGLLIIDPGEYIVRVKGAYGQYVESLYVQTNGPKGMRFHYFGNKNSKASGDFDYIAPEGLAITGLVIKSGKYVDAIGVVLRKRP